MRNSFHKDVIKTLVVLICVLLLCKLTMGIMAIVAAITGILAALSRKKVAMAFCFILFPLLVVFNNAIIGVAGLTLLTARFAFIMMVIGGLFSGLGSGGTQEKLPVSTLYAYLAVACISSIDGWMPLISYLKIFNFAMMLLGLSLLGRSIQQSVPALRAVRAMFMAIAILMIPGSVITYFFPSFGYSMLVLGQAAKGRFVTGADIVQSSGMILFSGMTMHSQMLSPVVSCLGTWVLCDMLLIEKKITKLHSFVLLCVPMLLYMSRSRGGLLMLVSVIVLTFLITIPRARISARVKRKMTQAVVYAVSIILVAGVYFEIKNSAITRWLRKTDDIATDTRGMMEAITESRQFLLDANLRDFKASPLFGKGFQVVDGMKKAYEAGMITWFSASVEKGVTPYVILGETGILGAVVFLIFLWLFYLTCLKRGYMALMTNFTCFLVANLADSTFFSPSGLGGFMWTVACIGAFSTDCLAKRLQRMQVNGIWEPERGNWALVRV